MPEGLNCILADQVARLLESRSLFGFSMGIPLFYWQTVSLFVSPSPISLKRLPQASPADIPVGDALFAHLRQMTQGSKDGTARQDRGGALFPPPIADTRAARLFSPTLFVTFAHFPRNTTHRPVHPP